MIKSIWIRFDWIRLHSPGAKEEKGELCMFYICVCVRVRVGWIRLYSPIPIAKKQQRGPASKAWSSVLMNPPEQVWLGWVSIILDSLTSDADVGYRISTALAAFGALSNVLRNKHVSNHLKGVVYKALVSTFLYGCGVWCVREDLFNQLPSFQKRFVRSMCRVSLHHTFHHQISSATLF